jgi:transcriptional regulator with XRE-family HTH domain
MPTEKGFFAERLRTLREQAGLSQATLAERAGIGVSTLRQFEYGRREPTYGTLVKLAVGLGMSLAVFDRPEGTEPQQPSGRPRKTDTAPAPNRPQAKPRRRTDRP